MQHAERVAHVHRFVIEGEVAHGREVKLAVGEPGEVPAGGGQGAFARIDAMQAADPGRHELRPSPGPAARVENQRVAGERVPRKPVEVLVELLPEFLVS
jgi:hypothetical protein